ncbi:MAG: hypothetical protein RR595_05760 [Lysinibacillus sp.]
MITPLDIKKAANTLLKSKFHPVPIKAQDVSKGFARPSITVEIDDVKIATLDTQVETSLTVRTYYFPDFKNTDESLDMLNMQFAVAMAYGNKLNVDDRSLDVNEPEGNIVDGILVHEFDMLFYQAVEEASTAIMDTIIYNGK